MSAAIHAFPGRDPNRAPHLETDDQLLAELAAAVSSPGTPHHSGRAARPDRPASVSPIRRARTAGANDLVVTEPMTRRRWAVAVAVVLAVATAFVLLAGLGGANADGDAPAVATTMLEDGQTLWGIAEDITPADGDVRATVAAIMDLNDFTSPTLPVGTVVRLPDLDG